MASPVYDSKIFRPFVQSLLHLASVKVAITLINEFHHINLYTAMSNIKIGISWPASDDPSDIEVSRARQSLLLIPAGLRGIVMDMIRNLNIFAIRWKSSHKHIRELEDNFTLYWKSDGMIDGSKTVEHLILNTNINIRTRFYLACCYCLEENIQSLWTEMIADGQTGNLDTDSMVCFWVRRMCDKSLVPWRQDVQEFFSNPEVHPIMARYSTFFLLLQPKDRNMFLRFLRCADNNDYLLCLNAATKEEEDVLLKQDAVKIFLLYLQSPMRNFFLDTCKQIWKYINGTGFCFMLELFLYRIAEKNTGYQQLLESFWESSPTMFQEHVRKFPALREKTDSCLNELRRKRKALFDDLSLSKRNKVDI